MPFRKYRKRRRSQAFSDEVEGGEKAEPEQEWPNNLIDGQLHEQKEGGGPTQETTVESGSENQEKEREVWDAFREENYEVLEQLPLSLHRSFSLIQELDEQVRSSNNALLPALKEYITLRKSILENPTSYLEAGRIAPTEQAPPQPPVADGMDIEDHRAASSTPSPNKRRRSARSPSKAQTQATLAQDSQAAIPPLALPPRAHTPPPSSRTLLTKIAKLSEEVTRASNEKVHVARFAYDLVDRHIRDLDRAIKEQETAISLGLRPGTYPASIILPEVVVPKGFRRAVHSPAPEIANEPVSAAATAIEGPPTLGISAPEAPGEPGPGLPRPRRRGKVKWSRKKPGVKDVSEVEPEAPSPEGAPATIQSVKLTVPPLASVTARQVDVAPEGPEEERYCYCNDVSYGEMIGCDNKGCKIEWFHLHCVGLTQAPKGRAKWYCRDCFPLMSVSKRKVH